MNKKIQKNVFGEPLEDCSTTTDLVTGWYPNTITIKGCQVKNE